MPPPPPRFLDLWFGPPDFIQLVIVVFKLANLTWFETYIITLFEDLAIHVGIVIIFN